MAIQDENERPALGLDNVVTPYVAQNLKWVIYDPMYGRFGNSGHWYTLVSDAETFDTMDAAKAAIERVGYDNYAVPAFVEIEAKVRY